MLDIVIDNIRYEYVNSVRIDDKSYIAYSDGKSIYINEFHFNDDEKIVLLEIDDKTLNDVKEVLS